MLLPLQWRGRVLNAQGLVHGWLRSIRSILEGHAGLSSAAECWRLLAVQAGQDHRGGCRLPTLGCSGRGGGRGRGRGGNQRKGVGLWQLHFRHIIQARAGNEHLVHYVDPAVADLGQREKQRASEKGKGQNGMPVWRESGPSNDFSDSGPPMYSILAFRFCYGASV